ncbi:MAG: hypothetical protein O2894_07340 [Planctomycetota bacterium]|nr:hypothetical protein [Planctomycetota bacterium]
MSTVAKILVVLNLLLAGYFLSSASTYLAKQEEFKTALTNEKKAHQDTRDEKDGEIASLRGRVQNVGTDLTKAQQESATLRAENTRLSAENTQMREAWNQLSASATKSANSVEQLTNSLSAANAMISSLQADSNQLRENLRAATEDRDAKVAQVNALQQQLTNETESRKGLEGQLADQRDQNQRLAFEIAYFKAKFPGLVASNQPAQTGRILASDNDANVCVISLGEEDGVQAGFQYIVSRGSEYIATIQVTDVQAKQSAGRAIKALSKGAINRGDKVMNGN